MTCSSSFHFLIVLDRAIYKEALSSQRKSLFEIRIYRLRSSETFCIAMFKNKLKPENSFNCTANFSHFTEFENDHVIVLTTARPTHNLWKRNFSVLCCVGTLVSFVVYVSKTGMGEEEDLALSDHAALLFSLLKRQFVDRNDEDPPSLRENRLFICFAKLLRSRSLTDLLRPSLILRISKAVSTNSSIEWPWESNIKAR